MITEEAAIIDWSSILFFLKTNRGDIRKCRYDYRLKKQDDIMVLVKKGNAGIIDNDGDVEDMYFQCLYDLMRR